MKLLKVWSIVALDVLLTLPAFAMESPAPVPEPAAPSEPIDEVTVVGQRTLMALRFQTEAAQEVVHQLFNDLNTDDSYDIVCKTTERNYSRIKHRQCKPRFAWDALATEGQMLARRARGENVVQGTPSDTEIGLAIPAMREHFVNVLRTSPELFDAIVTHARLMEKLAEARSTYFGEEDAAAE